MSETADVVIIGGGIVGTSTSLNLARRGCHKVIVLEKGLVGEGSTGRCAGGIRQQFSTEVNVRMGMMAVKIFENFEDEVGVDAEFHQDGYLFMATTPEELALFEANVAMQRRLGLDVKLISAQDVKEMLPHVNVEDVLGATFCQSDGYAGPNEVVQAFAKAARREGARIRENTEVAGIEVAGGRVRAVTTTSGDRIETERVLNAAGAWAGGVGRMAGVEVPVLPYRREIFMSRPFDEIKSPHPMAIDFHEGWYFRKEGPGIMMGGIKDDVSSFDTNLKWSSLEIVGPKALHRAPILERAEFYSGWAGPLEITPDEHSIIGPGGQVHGFYVCAGFSGHGFMHGPVAGILSAELMLGLPTSIDISPLRLERFAEGDLNQEALAVHNAGLER